MATIPEIISRWVDNDGAPLPFSKLYSYAAHSSVPKQLFSDVDCTIPLSNPLISDASGKFGQFFATSGRYKFALHSQTDDLIDTRDDIEASGNGSVGTVTSVQVTLGAALGAAQHVTTPPVTSAGNINMEFLPQSSRYVLIGPAGSTGLPTFRALEVADIPDLSGRYLPLAGGTMDDGAYIYLNGAYADTQISNTLMLVGDTNRNSFLSKDCMGALNDDGRTVKIYGWGISCDEPLSTITTYDTGFFHTGLQFGKTVFSGGSYHGYGVANIDHKGFSFYDVETQDCRLSATTSTGGNFTLARTDGDYNTFLRSITADVSSGAQVTITSQVSDAWNSYFKVTNAQNTVTLKASELLFTDTASGQIQTICSGGTAVYTQWTNGARNGGFSVATDGTSVSSYTATVAERFQITDKVGDVSYVGTDFEIRNNKALLIGGSTAISSARVGSFTGLTSTGGGTITGDFTVQRTSVGETSLQTSSLAGSQATLRLQTNGVDRWLFRKSNAAESGSNAGSNIEFVALSDAGSLIDFPISIIRAAGGAITFARPITANGQITMANTVAQQRVANSGTGATLVQAVTIPNPGGIYEVTVATSLNNAGAYGVRTQSWLVNAFMAFPYTAYAPATQSLMDVATAMTGAAPTCSLTTAVNGSLTFTVGGTGTKKIDITVRKLCDQASI